MVPGNRVTIMGIYSIKKVAAAKKAGREKGVGVGIRSSYLRVAGIQMDTEGAGEYIATPTSYRRFIPKTELANSRINRRPPKDTYSLPI